MDIFSRCEVPHLYPSLEDTFFLLLHMLVHRFFRCLQRLVHMVFLLIVVALVVLVQGYIRFPEGMPVEGSRTVSPPLTSFTGFRSRI